MNLILPIILLLSSIGLFFGYINPNYKGSGAPTDPTDYSTYSIEALKAEYTKYQDIANSATAITTQRDALVNQEVNISDDDQARLAKLLPSNIDNIRLIIEISQIAQARNLIAKGISVSDANTAASAIGQSNSLYGTLSLSFTVNATYANFLNLLSDLENNLRLLDITGITFTSTDTGFYDFNVTLNTYWLK